MKLTSLTATGTRSTITINDALFTAPESTQALQQAIRVYLSNARQGTAKVKTRSEINRTKKKWFRQKGTGNARHGARTPNIFVGGGVSHGPNGMQNWILSLPTQVKHVALRSAFALQAERIIVAESLHDLSGKTKEANALITSVATEDDLVLVILDETRTEVIKAMRNLPQVLVTTAARLNALDVARANSIITTKAALSVLEKRVASK